MDGIRGGSPLHSYCGMAGASDPWHDNFDLAVLHPPPDSFSIEFLPPKYKGSLNHGMRISPVTREGDSVLSHGRNSEYEIWRKWVDILWFQEKLEREYRNAAREKRVRLAQGKGVKSLNGMYKQDMASSWESLPPGPAPNSVAQDIYKLLPQLSRTATVFRASQSTIDQRQKQFQSLVNALFSNDMPSLIKELRATHHVTDFFSVWRRDYDNLEKTPKFHHLTSSVFASYFSESTPTLASINSSKRSSSTSRQSSTRPRSAKTSHLSSLRTTIQSCDRISNFSSASATPSSNVIKRLSGSSDEGAPIPEVTRPRALSNTSSDSSSTHSDGCSENGSTTDATPTIVGDSPITFDHNPQVPLERCSSILEVLPEEREMLAKSPESYFELPNATPSPTNRKTNRNWQVLSKTIPTKEGKHIVRASYQSHASIDSTPESFLDGINLSLSAIKEQDYRASIYTIMSINSMDPTSSGDECSLKRVTKTVSLSEFEMYPAGMGDEDSTQNAVPFPCHPPSSDLPRTPTRLSLDIPTTPIRNHEDSSFECLPSPTSANVSVSPSTPSPDPGIPLSIKAAHSTSIIMLRASKDTSFEDIRQRLYNKFVGQEGVPLSKEFAVAMIVPSTTDHSPAKSSSSKRSRSLSVTPVDKMELHFIDSQSDWEEVVLARESSKVSLRILDAPRA